VPVCHICQLIHLEHLIVQVASSQCHPHRPLPCPLLPETPVAPLTTPRPQWPAHLVSIYKCSHPSTPTPSPSDPYEVSSSCRRVTVSLLTVCIVYAIELRITTVSACHICSAPPSLRVSYCSSGLISVLPSPCPSVLNEVYR